MSAPVATPEFRVDPARLQSGRWCHHKDRQIGEGDIAASYSADKIGLEGRVRKPFVWQHTLWVCTSMVSHSGLSAAIAYQLLPERFFDGTPITYHENVMLGDEARLRAEGFYHGMAVSYGKQPHVLIGPGAVFLPSHRCKSPKQADLFDAL